MENKELVINLNFTTGYELSFLEVLNYKSYNTKSHYLQTHCTEFMDIKYRDMFSNVVVEYKGLEEDITLSSKKYPKLKEEVERLVFKHYSNEVILPKIDKLENELKNGLKNRLNNHLLNINFLDRLLLELDNFNYLNKDLEIFKNYLNISNFDAKYELISHNEQPAGTINFNLFNIQTVNKKVAFVSMFLMIGKGSCEVYQCEREKLNNEKTYYFIDNDFNYYLTILIRAVNKVVFNSSSKIQIVEK